MTNSIVEWQGIPTLRELRERVDHLDISADAKVLLMRIAETTQDAGKQLLAIGRRIVAFALNLIRQFPNLAFCLVMAMIVSALISSVPLLGPLLSLFLTPLLAAAGLSVGALLELKDGDLRGRINLLVTEFEQILG